MERVFVGKIINTHGIKGEFKVKSDFERKNDVFKIGNLIIINNESYEISSYRVHKGLDMVILKGFDNINQVIPFKGKNVYCDRTLIKLEKDEYLLSDLIGMKVIYKDELGIVYDYTNDANPLLFVKGNIDFYIPIKGNFIRKVDNDGKIIYVNESALELII